MMAASAVGHLITGILVAFLFAVFLVSQFMSAFEGLEDKNKVEVKENSVLHIKLDNPISDQATNPDFNFGFGGFSSEKVSGLNVMHKCLQRAAKDEMIKGIFLDISAVSGGMASVEELRNMLLEFKKSGKFIIAYSEIYTHKSYYLATVADQILLYPQGIAQHTGLTAEIMFMKGMIDKLDLDLAIIRGSNNKFKSAVEPFMYEKMSDANREQTTKYLNALWGHMMQGISEQRKISIEQLNLLADSLVLQTADAAKEHHFVDQIAYRDEAYALLKQKVGIEEKEELNLVAISDYNKDKRLNKIKKEEELANQDKSQIAVIYAVGDIIDGKGDKNSIGSVTLSEEIRKVRLDTTVKAIVLRVNSPGGSALASDVIWREVVLAKKAKPFIVSMGDVAASGGYYISCAADKIYAQPNTITGSIGVFGILPNTERMLKENIGITYDRVRTNTHSDLGSISRPLDDFEYKIIQKGVDDIYFDFTSKVAEGRKHTNLTREMVDSIGQGRVWAGTDALKIGLVDELGGLDAAINEAAKRAKLSENQYYVAEYPKVKPPFEELMESLKNESKIEIISQNFGLSPEMMLYLYNVKKILRTKGIVAMLPYHFDIH